ncbi:MAG: circadian clock KaiB family protein [Gemmatimonadales bacterium]
MQKTRDQDAAPAGGSGPVHVRLYVERGGPGSEAALDVLGRLCGGRLEVVDVRLQPERARRDRIVMTPTLIRVSPGPELRIVGMLHAMLSLARGDSSWMTASGA